MKGIYAVAVFVATLAVLSFGQSPQVVVPTECPAIDPMNTTIHLAHRDCTKFYMCLRGRKIEMICPYMDEHKNRLHFNPVLQVCDWPSHAGCKGSLEPSTVTDAWTTPSKSTNTPKPDPEPTPEPTTKKTTPEIPTPPDYCPDNTGGRTIKVRHATVCNYYYLCTDGTKIEQSCRPGNVFHPELHVCDFPKNVECGGSIIKPPLTPLSECPSKNVGKTITLPHECQCDRYYECNDGAMMLKKCSSKLHYDYFRGVCYLPSIVQCAQSISPTFPSTIVDGEECSMKQEGMKYEHQGSCTTYYECVNKRMILKNCAPGLHFNSTLQMCEYPNKECMMSTTASPIDKQGCVGECPLEDPSNYTIMLPNKDCRKFCMCSNGLAYPQNCAADLHYDYLRKVCDFPRKVKCWKPSQLTKTDGGRIPSNEYQYVGKENDWVNYVKDDNDDEMKENF